MTQELVVAQSHGYVPAIQEQALSADNLKRQVAIIRDSMRAVMRPNQHYGLIPGCGDKPALLKPGAEVLAMAFRFATEFKVTQADMGHGHREYEVSCILTHMPTGGYVGQGLGSCSTMEGKYRFRKAERTCPVCGQESIIKGKEEYGGGWLCFQKKGGCGAKFKTGDQDIEGQVVGQTEHDNPADYYNTCLKMAKKRAYVDAILTCTAASDVFTQDIEENPELFGGKPQQSGKPAPQSSRGRGSSSAPRADPLDMDGIRADLNACITVEQLESTFKGFKIPQQHPDYALVVELCREVKEMILSAADNENF